MNTGPPTRPFEASCERCGDVHDPRRCVGHVDEEDGSLRPCRRFPIKGGTVCPKHGGSARQVRAKARARLEQQRLEHELGQVLAEVERDQADTPLPEILLEQVARAGAMATVLQAVVSQLDMGDLWGRERLEVMDKGTDEWGNPVQELVGTGLARPHIAVEMYRTWSEQAAKLSKLALDAGVEERRVRVMEQQGEQLAGVIRGVLTGLGKLLDQDLLARPEVLDLVRRELTAIDTTAVDG